MCEPLVCFPVISTSAYSVRLAWAAAFSGDAPVVYNIRYRLK